MKPFSPTSKPLLFKIVSTIILITIVFWVVFLFIAQHFLQRSLQMEFSNSTEKIVKSIARQSSTTIPYADYFQIRRTLNDFFDDSYMNYLAIYTPDKKILAMYPKQIDGAEYSLMEESVEKNFKHPTVQKFINHKGTASFHFQSQILEENSNKFLGVIAIGGTLKPIQRALNTQMFFFTILGFIFLLLQIAVVAYASYFLTKPLYEVTKLLKENEEIEPDKFLPALIGPRLNHKASGEVGVFYSVYQKLLKNIHTHQLHEKDLAIRASIGQFASHIAHDMRTPLSVLESFMKTLPEGQTEDDKALKTATARSIRKLGHMADDLLDYAKAKQVQPTTIMVRRLIKDSLDEFKDAAAKSGITMELSCQDNTTARIDERKFNRVLGNLIQNAIHAIPPKTSGKIIISAGTSKEGWLKISVEDTGKGIKADHLPRLFDSSFTFGKPSGTGLGLSYCKNVIEAHGGRILVESEENKGSIFTIEIPLGLVDIPVGKPEGRFETVAGPLNLAAPFLVVDDDPDMLIQWRHIIKTHTKLDVKTADGPQQMNEMLDSTTDFSAAIVDYRFEGEEINGTDLLKILKQKGIPRRYIDRFHLN